MKNVKVSWVLPVYNAEKYLHKTIDSILRQTFINWELIIINDGSTDNSLEIIKSFKDDRIKVVSRENKGLSKSLNEGVELALGEYIARIDSDDINEINRLELQVAFLDSNPDYILVASNVSYINEKGVEYRFSTLPSSHRAIKNKLKVDNCIFHPTVLVRKKALIKSGGYNNEIGCYWEDYHLWLKLIDFGKFYIIPDYLLKYRVHSTSISQNTPKEIRESIDIFKKNNNMLSNTIKPVLFMKKLFLSFKYTKKISFAIIKLRDFIKL
ncbi:glycosyltransferase [Aliivibrio fischeri]|uniref:glycosyltransferase n=1 Tax=Aliivibrio fischeri TaxID=668 RepID=UPI0007C4FC7A|nr:glycosyltransferase [Aliivibrio fischeri]